MKDRNDHTILTIVAIVIMLIVIMAFGSVVVWAFITEGKLIECIESQIIIIDGVQTVPYGDVYLCIKNAGI